MSDEENPQEKYLFYVDRAKTGRAGCKKCKQKISTGGLRMAKVASNPFGSGVMKMWHHIDCIFEVFARQRASTAKIESVQDIGGWESLSKEDQEEILSKLPESVRQTNNKVATSSTPTKTKNGKKNKETIDEDQKQHKDNSFKEYRRLCANIADNPSYLDKTNIVRKFITEGTDGESFKGDLVLLIKLLLPGVIKRIYNLQSKQIIKLFSRLFCVNQDDMLESLEQGDVAETIREYFEKSDKVKPPKKCTLTIHDVDRFLDYLSKLTREEDQLNHFSSIVPLCTANDLKMIIRLIKHDLRINAGAKHILDAVHPDAYEAFQASRDINLIIEKFKSTKGQIGKKVEKNLSIEIKVLVPVLPMLAQACKSAEEALKKCPNGIYSEIKYDGERVQVHKQSNTFKYFSRSLKPVMAHKVKHLEDYIPKAFPYGKDLILDSEILMIDTVTGQPLPFGTLGKHKKDEYQNANVCLFVFDCIYYNGESLVNRPIKERKQILQENMIEIPFRIVFSEMKSINSIKELKIMMTEVFKKGLEGLVLKDIMSTYEPGKRHWLKVKKDYLCGGAIADSADLVVLGAWYGTGQKGGMMSIFLMGCYDKRCDKWCTVTKVHTGIDDKKLESLQAELDMEKISKDPSKVPHWLKCDKSMIPDFIAKDPKKQQVWEITGAEFTKTNIHSADGISVRFPRITRFRDDKTWETATNLEELKILYKKSKETGDFELTDSTISNEPESTSPSKGSESSPEKPSTSRKRPASTLPKSPRAPKNAKYVIKNPLPDLFVGMKIKIPSFISTKESKLLMQYFVAYGGEIIEDNDKTKSTHKIVSKEEIDKKSNKCITLDQILESIRKNKRMFG